MRNIAELEAQVGTDLSHEYILIQSQDVINIVAKDFSREVEFPRSLGTPFIVTWYDGKWKVRTQDRVYENIGQDWEKNMRFTDYIDLTPYDRLGYIDASDSEHLSLGNLPLGQ